MQGKRLPPELSLPRNDLTCDGYDLAKSRQGFTAAIRCGVLEMRERRVRAPRSSLKMPALQNLFFSWTYQNLPLTLAIDPS